jgi:hypothetical protein
MLIAYVFRVSYLIVGVVRRYLGLKEFGENYDEPIRNSTMDWYARTNSRFVTLGKNYVTIKALKTEPQIGKV